MPTKPQSKQPTGRLSANSTRTGAATKPSSSVSTKPITGYTSKHQLKLDLRVKNATAKGKQSPSAGSKWSASAAENAQVKVGSQLEEAVARALAVGIDGDYTRLYVWRLDAVKFLDHLGSEGFAVKKVD